MRKWEFDGIRSSSINGVNRLYIENTSSTCASSVVRTPTSVRVEFFFSKIHFTPTHTHTHTCNSIIVTSSSCPRGETAAAAALHRVYILYGNNTRADNIDTHLLYFSPPDDSRFGTARRLRQINTHTHIFIYLIRSKQ